MLILKTRILCAFLKVMSVKMETVVKTVIPYHFSGKDTVFSPSKSFNFSKQIPKLL